MAGELIIPNGLVISGSMDLSLSPSTASLGPGLTTNLLSMLSSQVNFDFDELEGDFDLIQTGSLNVQGSANFNSSTGVRVFPVLSGAPTFTGVDGQFVFSTLSGNYYIYVWISGGWRRGTLI